MEPHLHFKMFLLYKIQIQIFFFKFPFLLWILVSNSSRSMFASWERFPRFFTKIKCQHFLSNCQLMKHNINQKSRISLDIVIENIINNNLTENIVKYTCIESLPRPTFSSKSEQNQEVNKETGCFCLSEVSWSHF